ncbi:IS110 family transposase [Pelagibius sp. Alg239-R121]|uniref:IS110 family transposase n=1 Tax=Pelagibius sp. Alg239-R121 TaxID=2993448 RepID=UPI0024A6681A|nr:IS110 family transposase [Pelagibius sp. Alg239-R121]
MKKITIVGVDLSKHAFQIHGAAADGSVVFHRKLSRSQFPKFMSEQPSCIVAMEACSTSHYWAREMERAGHKVKLIAPIYVKPFVKRQKNDAADAEAIVEAALRSNMRFVPAKSAQTQARAMLFRTREQLIGQRTEALNALRGHLAEFGLIAPRGVANLVRLAALVENPESDLPDVARDIAHMYLDRIAQLATLIDRLMMTIKEVNGASNAVNIMRSMPGVGPIWAIAIDTFAPEMNTFERGRDFSAWLGLTPRQHSTGGKQRLGRTSKMGQRDIRRLLIIGAMSRIASAQRYKRAAEPWLQDKLNRKPRMVAAIALASKMARQIWAMLTKGERYNLPVATTA